MPRKCAVGPWLLRPRDRCIGGSGPEFKDSSAEQVAPNVVVYSDRFDDIEASIRYTYEVGAFHSDVVLHEAPRLPSDYGLSELTRLEVWTEFGPDSTAAEDTTRLIRREEDPARRAAMIEPDFTDETLDFGDDV